MFARIKLTQFWFLTPFILVVISTHRVWGTYPTILQDEYIYMVQARHALFADHSYTNYLFSAVMRATLVCGPDFYSCAKAINAVIFAIGLLFTLFIALRILPVNWAIFAASITAISPLALQISYFMPEAMYFAVMTLVIWITLKAVDVGRVWVWLLVGLALGLAALVKPHAIFIIPAILVFAFLIELRKVERVWPRVLGSSGLIVGGFLLSKLGLGFAFAGNAGLKLFGGYGSPVNVANQVLDNNLSSSSDLTTPEAGESGTSETISNLSVFLDVFPLHLSYHFGFMLLLAGVPLLLALKLTANALIKKDPLQKTTSYFILIFLISGTLLFIIPAFEAYVTVAGDDHSTRLILRYYEFLIPQFLIMGLVLPSFIAPKLISRVIQAGIIIVASIWLAESYARNFGWKFADSSALPGIATNTSFLIVAIFVSFGVAYWAEKPGRGSLVLGRGVIPVVLVVALFTSQNTLIERRGFVAEIERAGWAGRDLLKEVSGSDIMVVGDQRANVFAVKFWIDKPGIKDLLVVQGGTLTSNYLDGAKYLVILGNYNLGEPNSEIEAGTGFRLVQLFE